MDFTEKEIKVLSEALVEYESNNWEILDDNWQKVVNGLLIKLNERR